MGPAVSGPRTVGVVSLDGDCSVNGDELAELAVEPAVVVVVDSLRRVTTTSAMASAHATRTAVTTAARLWPDGDGGGCHCGGGCHYGGGYHFPSDASHHVGSRGTSLMAHLLSGRSVAVLLVVRFLDEPPGAAQRPRHERSLGARRPDRRVVQVDGGQRLHLAAPFDELAAEEEVQRGPDGDDGGELTDLRERRRHRRAQELEPEGERQPEPEPDLDGDEARRCRCEGHAHHPEERDRDAGEDDERAGRLHDGDDPIDGGTQHVHMPRLLRSRVALSVRRARRASQSRRTVLPRTPAVHRPRPVPPPVPPTVGTRPPVPVQRCPQTTAPPL